jgi:CBS domain-containing protein
MAQAGGIGVIHKNLDAEAQANEVRKVRKFESGMVVNPVTIHREQTLADALALMSAHQISGIPVVERVPPGRWPELVRDRQRGWRLGRYTEALLKADRQFAVVMFLLPRFCHRHNFGGAPNLGWDADRSATIGSRGETCAGF